MSAKTKLFETVIALHNAGTVKLSASERDLISRETEDLVQKSLRNRSAAKMPEGFDEILKRLKSEDPDEAFELVVDFLTEKGVIKSEKKDDKKDEKVEKDEKKEPKKEDKKDENEVGKKEDLFSPKEEKEHAGESSKERVEHEDRETPEEEEAEHKFAQSEVKLDDAADKEGADRLKEIQERMKAEAPTTSLGSMGIEEDKTAYRVEITAGRNLVAFGKKGQLFIASPNDETKANLNALRRLANKVLGLLITKGPKTAAARCGARLVAGVDEDVETTGSIPVEPENAPVTEGVETVTEEKPKVDETSVLDGGEVVTEEKPDSVTITNREARIRKLRAKIRNRRADTMIDDIDTTTSEKPGAAPTDVRDGAEDVFVDVVPKPTNDTGEGLALDFKTVEANYRKLYAARLKTALAEKQTAFADKFYTCLKIASARMRLNQDAHPLKIAAADILMSDNVEFTDGSLFKPMDVRTATEVIELISAEGHDAFVDRLLAKATDLMSKSPEYLKETAEDLETLAPSPVAVEDKMASMPIRSQQIRRAASRGNFVDTGRGASASNKPGNIRDAISFGTKIGQRARSYKG